MKNWLSLRAAWALSLMVPYLALAQPAHAEKRVALVIGNNDYKNVPKLQKAVNDAGQAATSAATVEACGRERIGVSRIPARRSPTRTWTVE
jgi:hypothetical protein